MEVEIGKSIKKLRVQHGMTLRELGERSNLSISYLSLVERGKTSISFSSLKKIAEALGVSEKELSIKSSSSPGRVARSYELSAICLSGSKFIYHSLRGEIPAEKRKMEPVLVTILPGQTREDVAPYSHEGEEFGFILEGTLTFIVENKSYDLVPGDSLHIPSRISHNWANFSNKLVRMLYVSTCNVFD